jgi:hypothetical protein
MRTRKIKKYITAQAEPKLTTAKEIGDKKFLSPILKAAQRGECTKTSLVIASGQLLTSFSVTITFYSYL